MTSPGVGAPRQGTDADVECVIVRSPVPAWLRPALAGAFPGQAEGMGDQAGLRSGGDVQYGAVLVEAGECDGDRTAAGPAEAPFRAFAAELHRA